VGKEDISFNYIAPDEENSNATEDKIIVYNSCDILRKDEYPMAKTALALIKTDPFMLVKNNPHDAQLFVDERF